MDDRNVDLVGAGIDIALRMGDLQDSSLVARKIGQSPRGVTASPKYLEQAGEPTSPAERASHQAVVYDLLSGGTIWDFTRREDGDEFSAALEHGVIAARWSQVKYK